MALAAANVLIVASAVSMSETAIAAKPQPQRYCYDVILFTTPIIVGDHRCFDSKKECQDELKSRDDKENVFNKCQPEG